MIAISVSVCIVISIMILLMFLVLKRTVNMVNESSKKYSGKVALSYQVPDVDKTIDITYEEMYEKIDWYARALTKYGIIH